MTNSEENRMPDIEHTDADPLAVAWAAHDRALEEVMRLEVAMDAAMAAIQDTEFTKAHCLLYEARHV